MPGGPLAHICLVVSDLDRALADWRAILAELDPAQLEEPVVVVERWEAGEDVMSSATFVNPAGPRSSSSARSTTARSGAGCEARRARAPHLLHLARPAGRGRRGSTRNGRQADEHRAPERPEGPWQHWTFISPESSHGTLVELAYPYRPVDGAWLPGEGARPVSRPAKEARMSSHVMLVLTNAQPGAGRRVQLAGTTTST